MAMLVGGDTRNCTRFNMAVARTTVTLIKIPMVITLRGPPYKITKEWRNCTLAKYRVADAKAALCALAVLPDVECGHHFMVFKGRHWYFAQKLLGDALGDLIFTVVCEHDDQQSAFLLICVYYARIPDASDARIKEQAAVVATECDKLAAHLTTSASGAPGAD